MVILSKIERVLSEAELVWILDTLNHLNTPMYFRVGG